jgi:hypothetical protein
MKLLTGTLWVTVGLNIRLTPQMFEHYKIFMKTYRYFNSKYQFQYSLFTYSS